MPRTHVDTDGERVREELLRGLDVDVLDSGGRPRVEVRVVRGELTTVGVHATGNFTGLLVRPADGRTKSALLFMKPESKKGST